MPAEAKLFFVGLTLWLCGSQPAIGCWKEPEIVLEIPNSEKRPNKFLGVRSDGAFVFDNQTVTILNGKLVATPLRAPKFFEETPPPEAGPYIAREAMLEETCKSYKPFGLLTCDGRIERLTEIVGLWFQSALPGGGFLLKESYEAPYERKRYSDYTWFRFYEFAPDGTYLKEWTKPPEDYIFAFRENYYDSRTGCKGQVRVVFPHKEYRLCDSMYWADHKLPNRFVTVTSFGWIAENPYTLYAFDDLGRVICEETKQSGSPIIWHGLAKLEADMRARDKDHEDYPESSPNPSEVKWDRNGNAFVAISTSCATYILKLPWVDEDVQPLSKPAEIIPLDGWGRPLPENPGPPSKTLQDRGDILTFHFPEQVLPLENGLFPVYSLWDYQLSAFQRDNPAAIRGAVAEAGYNTPALMMYVPEFAPTIALDLNPLFEGRVTTQKLTGYKVTGPYVVAYGTEKGQSRYELVHEPEYLPRTAGRFRVDSEQVYDEGGKKLKVKKDAVISIENRQLPTLGLDETKPDILRVYASLPYLCYMARITMIETGANTKVFIAPTVMTRAWLEPKGLSPKERATLKAYSKNWVNGKEDNVMLKETAPGSRRFTSQDGNVIYELAHLLDEEGNTEPAPSPEILDRLYLYLTDPALGLSHQPQLLYENGIDTGEYWSYAEPTGKSINRGFMKPWSYKHWSQLSEELEKAKFTVEASGPSVSEGSVFRVLWDDPDGKTQHYDLPLVKGADGKYCTTTPLLCFEAQGCDIGGTWYWTDKVATPQIPGALTCRSNHLRLVVYSPEDLQEEAAGKKVP